jgi:hypothetical protein
MLWYLYTKWVDEYWLIFYLGFKHYIGFGVNIYFGGMKNEDLGWW